MPDGLRPPAPPAGSPPTFGGGMVNGPASNNVGWGTMTTEAGTLMAGKLLLPGHSMPNNPAVLAYIQNFDRWLDKSPNQPENRRYNARNTLGELHEFKGSDIFSATMKENGRFDIGGKEVDTQTYVNLGKQLDASMRGFEREIENHRLAGKLQGFC